MHAMKLCATHATDKQIRDKNNMADLMNRPTGNITEAADTRDKTSGRQYCLARQQDVAAVVVAAAVAADIAVVYLWNDTLEIQDRA